MSKRNISAQDKINAVKRELTKHYEEFYNSPYIEEFEKEFMRKYVKTVLRKSICNYLFRFCKVFIYYSNVIVLSLCAKTDFIEYLPSLPFIRSLRP